MIIWEFKTKLHLFIILSDHVSSMKSLIHMDYFYDFLTFWSVKMLINNIIRLYMDGQKWWQYIKNHHFVHFVLKKNVSLMGLEQNMNNK